MHSELLEELHTKHYQAAYAYALSLCKNKEIAEDIVSSAFEKALMSLEQSMPSFRFWMFVVCKNLWIDQVRRNKHTADALQQEPEATAWMETPESFSLQKERSQIVFQCMMRLPSNYREVLTLQYYANTPLSEISMIMKLSYGNTKTLACRARVRLKSLLEEQGYEF